MMNYFLLVIVPNLNYFVNTLGIFGIILTVSAFLVWLHLKSEARDERDEEEAAKLLQRVVKIFLVSISIFFITCFFPSKDEIIQLKVLNCLEELKGVKEIPQKLIDKLNKILEIEEDKKS